MPIDYSKYPPNWKTEIRPAVLKRAGQINHPLTGEILRHAECEFCGVENHRIIHRFGKEKYEWIYWPDGIQSEAYIAMNKKATKVILTIAHLDHDKLNHNVQLDRLKALCQKCHLQYDMPRHIANRKSNKLKNNNNHKLDL